MKIPYSQYKDIPSVLVRQGREIIGVASNDFDFISNDELKEMSIRQVKDLLSFFERFYDMRYVANLREDEELQVYVDNLEDNVCRIRSKNNESI